MTAPSPTADFLAKDVMRMVDHVKESHDSDPEQVTLDCDECADLFLQAQRNAEERYERTFGHKPGERRTR